MTKTGSHNPNEPSKPVATLSAFGAMLDLVSRKVTTLVEAIRDRDPRVPALCMQLRGALDVVKVGADEAGRMLDTIDAGGA